MTFYLAHLRKGLTLVITSALVGWVTPSVADISFLKARPTSQTYLPENTTKAPENHDLVARFPAVFGKTISVEHHIAITWGSGGTLGEIIAKTMSRIDEMERDGQPGLSLADLNLYRGMKFAEYRAGALQAFFRHDLDGDLLLTHEEYLAGLDRMTPDLKAKAEAEYKRRGYAGTDYDWLFRSKRRHLEKLWTQNDQNEDGIVTVKEVMRSSNRYLEQRIRRPNSRYLGTHLQPPRAMDLNSDGIITRSEVSSALIDAFANVDQNADGRITLEEAKRHWK